MWHRMYPQDIVCEILCCLVWVSHAQSVNLRKLTWATQLVYCGRFHVQQLLDSIGSLRYLSHRTRVTHDMRADMAWWLDFIDCFNGLTKMMDFHPAASLAIDVCTETASALYMDHMFYTSWKPYWSNAAAPRINYKEALALEPAAMVRIPLWGNKYIRVHCDNKCAVYTINNQDSKVHGANMGPPGSCRP